MDFNLMSLLTGIAGGAIPALVAYYLGIKNINTSLRINAEKLSADRENLRRQLECQEQARQEQNRIDFEKMNDQERKKLIAEFFKLTNPGRVATSGYELEKCENLRFEIFVLCPVNYFSYIEVIAEFVINNQEMLKYDTLSRSIYTDVQNPDKELQRKLDTLMRQYQKYYYQARKATQQLLNGIKVEATNVSIDNLRMDL